MHAPPPTLSLRLLGILCPRASMSATVGLVGVPGADEISGGSETDSAGAGRCMAMESSMNRMGCVGAWSQNRVLCTCSRGGMRGSEEKVRQVHCHVAVYEQDGVCGCVVP